MNKPRFNIFSHGCRLTFPAVILIVGCANKMTIDFPKRIQGEVCKIVIYRESRFEGSLVALPISLDGRLIAAIRMDKRIEVLVKPGMSVIGCGGVNLPITVESNSVYYICIDSTSAQPITRKTKTEAGPRLLETTLLATNAE